MQGLFVVVALPFMLVTAKTQEDRIYSPKLEGTLRVLLSVATAFDSTLSTVGPPVYEYAAMKQIDLLPPDGVHPPRARVEIFLDEIRSEVLDSLARWTEIEGIYEKLVQAVVPLRMLNNVAELSGVNFVQTPLQADAHTVEGEGVKLTGAKSYHNNGWTGSGVKIAVLDLGFSGYASLLGSELPDSVVTKSFYNSVQGNGDITGGGEKHGTACAEIVHEIAPGAKLYLVNAKTLTETDTAINWIVNQGVKIVSYSIGWVNCGPYDGTGAACEIANKARRNGILFVNSAGNYAHKHYEGLFTDVNSNGFHEFIPNDEYMSIYATANSWIKVFLSWDDWPKSSQDYDLYLYNSNFVAIDSSTTIQDGTQPPTESIIRSVSSVGTYYLAVKKKSATRNVHLEVYSFNNDFEHFVPGSSLADPATSDSAFSVAAIGWQSDVAEYFSSRGPTNDGRMKPDIASYDGVLNQTYGRFYGTSSAAPHVAAAAAIYQSRVTSQGGPQLTAWELQRYLESDAVDLGKGGRDSVYGVGKLQLNAASGDPYENNDAFQSSYPITCGEIYTKGKIYPSGDVDWFKFSTSRFGQISVKLSPPSGCNYDLYLYELVIQFPLVFVVVRDSSLNDRDAEEMISYRATGPGNFLLKVVGRENASSRERSYLLSGTWPTQGLQKSKLGKATTCKSVQNSSPWDPVNETADFTYADERIYGWIRLDTVYKPARVRWIWYMPDGREYTRDTSSWSTDPASQGSQYWTWWKFWYWIALKDFPPADYGGSWEVRFFVEENYSGSWVHVASVPFSIQSVTRIVENIDNPLKGFQLYQNYPNPFNSSTTIRFTVPSLEEVKSREMKITLELFDVLGRKITTLVDGYRQPGEYAVIFDAVKENLPSGVYFYQLRVGEFIVARKLILLK